MYTDPITLHPQQDMPYDLRPRALQWDGVMHGNSACALPPSINSAVPFPAAHMAAPQELLLLSPQATADPGSSQGSPSELGAGGYPDVNTTSGVRLLLLYPSTG